MITRAPSITAAIIDSMVTISATRAKSTADQPSRTDAENTGERIELVGPWFGSIRSYSLSVSDQTPT